MASVSVEHSAFPSSASTSKLQRWNGSRAIARVLRWDTTWALVECPFCEQPHRHAISFFPNGEENLRQPKSNSPYTFHGLDSDTRWFVVAPCHHAGYTYKLVFPFEKHDAVKTLSWEIRTSASQGTDDSHFQCFETVGFRKPEVNPLLQPDQASQRDSLTDHFENISIKDQARTFADEKRDNRMTPIRTRDSPASRARVNEKGDRWGCVHDYVTCPHFNHDLRIEGTLGCSRLSIEVAHGNRTNVQDLLRIGVDVNAGDSRGRTPLMEAALWTRVELVGLLLAAGASTSQKDRDGRIAADFAEENERNDEEREYRHVDYAEKPFKSKSRRRHIRALLGVAAPLDTALTKSDIANLFQPRFVKSPDARTALLINPKRGIPIARQDQTVGVLLRGSPFEPVAAVGGWAGIGIQSPLLGDGYARLDSNYWAHKTLSFSKRIGFTFEAHELDPSSAQGLYHASHVEAQLLCFVAHRHQLFVEDVDDRDRQIRLEILFHYQHMETLTKAEIVINQKPCPSCILFMRYLAKRMWLDFVVVVAKEVFLS
ncbi:ankyrin repeat protein [Colletotrichum orchidophilum]|uniref:Ankyrin repeat protein n=1 Tax=Colletotrichum orchidophilum TaxID=1209926 RepID=A0A1G4BRR3_9PEZI|nr:ankyrin repeat protein [Colletotrichum orchidophilum]OHF04144.1 ankyrin repeat protein [Colletotrichum orchidophilum]